MYVGYYGGATHYQVPEAMQLHTARKVHHRGAVPNLLVAIALKRNSSAIYAKRSIQTSHKSYCRPAKTTHGLPTGHENGVDQVVLADNAQEGTGSTQRNDLYIRHRSIPSQRPRHQHSQQLRKRTAHYGTLHASLETSDKTAS